MILVSLAQLGCDAQTFNESPVVENAEVQVPQPTEVHLPVSFASGDTSRYRVLATTKRGVRFFPRLSSIEPKESTTEFGLVCKVTSVEADGVILTAHVDYVATRANVGTAFFDRHASKSCSNRAIYAGALSYQPDGTLYTSEVRGNMYDILASGEIHLGQSHRKEQYAPGLGNLVTTSTVDITAQVARRTR